VPRRSQRFQAAAPAIGGKDGHEARRGTAGLFQGESNAINAQGESVMLKDLQVMPVLPAKDIDRAREFYRDKLGLEPTQTIDNDNLVYQCGNGTGFLLYRTDNAGSAKNTQMGWGAEDVEREVEELRSRGVVFEEYDMPGLKTENGIATMEGMGKGAWFLDSEGNILNISSIPVT
jgi:catechol 2,3-dioxygenase-like lactoylglutathione lyase family enzyme